MAPPLEWPEQGWVTREEDGVSCWRSNSALARVAAGMSITAQAVHYNAQRARLHRLASQPLAMSQPSLPHR